MAISEVMCGRASLVGRVSAFEFLQSGLPVVR